MVKPACLENRRSRVPTLLWPSQVSKKQNVSFPLTRNDSEVWRTSLGDRDVAFSASDCQGSNFESCVWRAVSSHHPQEVLLAQFRQKLHSFSFVSVRYLEITISLQYLKHYKAEIWFLKQQPIFNSFFPLLVDKPIHMSTCRPTIQTASFN